MATDTTTNQTDIANNAATTHESDVEQVQLTQSGTPVQVQVPQGQNVVRVQVTPGETVELPFPADGLVARLADGNLAVKVGDVTVILLGYQEAIGQGEVNIVGSDGKAVDVAAVIAATDPNLDIQTAAGPAAGDQGTGPDNNGGLFTPFDPAAGIGGLNAVGGLNATNLNYKEIQREFVEIIENDEEDTSPEVVSITGFRVVNEDDLGEGGYGEESFTSFKSLDSFNIWQSINDAFQQKYGEDTEVDCDFHYWWFGEYYDEGNDPFDTKDHEEGSVTDGWAGDPDDGKGVLPDDNNGSEANGIDQDKEPTSVTAKVTINFFNDVPGTVSFSNGGSTPIIDQLQAMNLTSHSVPLQYMIIPADGSHGDILVAYKLDSFGGEGSCCYANVVFTIAIDHDTATDPISEFDFTFTIYGVIDNAEKLGTGVDGEDVLNIPTPFFMVDSDGSTVLTPALSFDDVDDVPQLGALEFDWIQGGGNNDEGSSLFGEFYGPVDIIPTDTDLVHDETDGKQNNGNGDGVPGPDNDPGASGQDEDDTYACVDRALEAAGMDGFEGIIGAARIRPNVSFGADGPAGEWQYEESGPSGPSGPNGPSYVGNKEAGLTVFDENGDEAGDDPTVFSTAFQLYIGDPANPVSKGETNWTITYNGVILQVQAEQLNANTIVGYAIYKPVIEPEQSFGDIKDGTSNTILIEEQPQEIRIPVFVLYMDPEAHNGWDYNGNLTFVQLHQINHVDPLNPDESSAPLQIYPEGYQAPAFSLHDEFNSLDGWTVLAGGSAEIVGDIDAAGNQPNPANQALLLANDGGEEGGEDGSSVEDIEDFFGLSSGTLAAMMDDGDPSNDGEAGSESPTDGTAIRQEVNVSAGEILTVKFNFLEDESDAGGEGGSSLPYYQDFAFIVIGDQVFRLSDVNLADLSSNASFNGWSWDEESGYLTFTHEFTTTGPIQIGFGVMNEGDTSVDPALLIDELSIGDPQVPGSEIKFRATDYDGDYVDAPVSIVVQDDGPVLVGVDYDNCHCQGEGVNLIQNGSFENTPVVPFGTHGIFNSIPGWQSDGGEGGGFEVQNHAAGDPQDGSQHIELDGNYNSNMFQDVATTDGESYTLSLWYTPRVGDPSTDGVEVWFDGHLIATLDGAGMTPGIWQEFTYVVNAGNGDGTPDLSRLEFRGVGASDSVGGYIDNVSLTLSSECVGQIDEDNINEQGNPGGPGDDKGQDSVTGQVVVNFGTDQPGRFDLTALKITDDKGGTVFDTNTNNLRTATGEEVVVVTSDDGSKVFGYVDGEGGEEGQFDEGDKLVFELTIDQLNGAFEFDLYEPLDHPFQHNPDKGDGKDHSGSWEDNLHFTFDVKATDVDGDFVTTEIEIDVDDDSPRICATENVISLAVDESILAPRIDGDLNDDEDGGGSKAELDSAPVHATLATLATVIGANAADGSQLFHYNAGADGEKSHLYALTAANGSPLADGTNSGLTDTLSGDPILLYTEEVDGVAVVVGRAGGDEGPAVFAITVDGQTGALSIAQYRAVQHPESEYENEAGENDEVLDLPGGILGIKLTVVDNDDDTRSLTVDLGEDNDGAIVTFDDDGPRFTNKIGTAELDEDALQPGRGADGIEGGPGDALGAVLASYSNNLKIDFGTDGPRSIVFNDEDDMPELESNGEPVEYEWVATPGGLGTLWGFIGTEPNRENIFKLEVTSFDNGGEYTLTLLKPLDHPEQDDKGTEQTETSFEDNLIFDLDFTATDGDGDTINGSLGVNIDDDSPDACKITITLDGDNALVHDETAGVQDDGNETGGDGDVGASSQDEDDIDGPSVFEDFEGENGMEGGEDGAGIGYAETGINLDLSGGSANPNAAYGADGPGEASLALTDEDGDGFDGDATNLYDTATGNRIFLFTEDTFLVGRVGDGTGSEDDEGAIAFALNLNDFGGDWSLALAQYRAIHHDLYDNTDPVTGENDPDESASLLSDTLGALVYIQATVIDNDGDTVVKRVPVDGEEGHPSIQFQDDGPVLNGVTYYSQDAGSFLIQDGESGYVDEDWLSPNGNQDKDTNPDNTNDADGTANNGDGPGQTHVFGNISVNFGNDLPGSFAFNIDGLTLANNVKSSWQTATGDDIWLDLNAVPGGYLLTGYAADANGDPIGGNAFTVHLNSSNGQFEFDLLGALNHEFQGKDGSYEDDIGLTFGVRATDGDGDWVDADISIIVDDDGPVASIGRTQETLVHDETDGVQNNGSADGVPGPDNDPMATFVDEDDMAGPVPAPLSDVAFAGGVIGWAQSNGAVVQTTNSRTGADGGDIVLSLGLSNPDVNGLVDSGLKTTIGGYSIYLTVENGVVVGRVENGLEDNAAFAISLAQDGTLSVVQYMAIDHGNNEQAPGLHDEQLGITDNALYAIVTVTDNDGDVKSNSVSIGQAVQFQDDGPVVSATDTSISLITDESTRIVDDADEDGDRDGGASTNRIELDEAGVTEALEDLGDASEADVIGAASASAAALFTYDAGTDGFVSKAYGLEIVTSLTGLIDTASGQLVKLISEGGFIKGVTETGGDLVFAFKIDTDTGQIDMAQFRAVNHGGTEDPSAPDELITLGAGFLTATLSVTDGDGDVTKGSRDLGSMIGFEDDGPSIGRNLEALPSLTVDETVLTTNDTKSFAGLFTALAGTDGQDGDISYELGVKSGSSIDSGVVDVATGHHVFLFLIGGQIVGKEGTNAATALATGATVFTVSVNAAGEVTLDQVRAVKHDDPLDPDEASSPVVLSAADLITLTATITDKDGDKASAVANIANALNFEDDGPSLTGIDSAVMAMAVGSVTEDIHGLIFGEDGPASGGGLRLTGWSDLPGITETLSPDGKTLTATIDGSGGTVFYTLTLNNDNTYTFNLVTPTSLQTVAIGDQFGAGGPVETITVNAGGNSIVFDGLLFDAGTGAPINYPASNVDDLNPNSIGFGVSNGNIEDNEGFKASLSQATDGMGFTVIGGGNLDSTTILWRALAADGVTVVDSGTMVVTGLNAAGNAGVPITLSSDAAFRNIEVRFDHADSNDWARVQDFNIVYKNGTGDLHLDFTATATDGDGDTVSANFAITAETPQIQNFIVVGENVNDDKNQTTDHRLDNSPNQPDGLIEGAAGNDVLIGDVGGKETIIQPGQNYSLALVCDTSSSMSDGGRMALMKAAVTNFVNQLLPHNGTLNITLISFGSTAATEITLTLTNGNLPSLLQQISDLQAGQNADGNIASYTNYEAAMTLAKTYMDGQPAGYEKHVYFMTDGVPTAYNGNTNGDGDAQTDLNEIQPALNVINPWMVANPPVQLHGIGITNAADANLLRYFDNTALQAGTVNTNVEGGTVTDNYGQPLIITSADQLTSALIGGGSTTTIYPVGNDLINGGAGNDAILGDSIFSGTKDAGWADYVANHAGWTPEQMRADIHANLTTGDKSYAGEGSVGGNDTINGGDGNDVIFGQGGKDTIHGDNNDDYIDGGSGNDTLFGDAGNDTLIGGVGTDTLNGGAGNDTMIYDIDDSFNGGSEQDVLKFLSPIDQDMNSGFVNRIDNVEVIDLRNGSATDDFGNGSSSEALSAADVLAMSDSGTMYILGEGDGGEAGAADDEVRLASGWNNQGNVTVNDPSNAVLNGLTFVHYQNGTAHLYVQNTVDVDQ